MKIFSLVCTLVYALYIPSTLFLNNISLINFFDILPIILLIIISSVCFWFSTYSLVKDHERASILLAVFWILFFSFGKVLLGFVGLLNYYFPVEHYHGQLIRLLQGYTGQQYLFALILLLFSAFAFLVLKSSQKFIGYIAKLFGFIALVLLISTVFEGLSKIYNHVFIANKSQEINGNASEYITTISGNNKVEHPDIIYIILDAYGRTDVLSKNYSYDNSSFIQGLKDRGFYVANNSRTNYPMTVFSLACSLNLNYVDKIQGIEGINGTDISPILNAINHNYLFRFLKGNNYSIVNINSGYVFSSLSDVDISRSPQNSSFMFISELINYTPLKIILKNYPYNLHRESIKYVFDQLTDFNFKQYDEPVFVFAHIYAPHPPFVFGPNGEPNNPPYQFTLVDGVFVTTLINKEEYAQGYNDQITYVTKRAEELIDSIIQSTDGQAVIILQGDHGPRSDSFNSEERFPILNAYYFPDKNYSLLYEDISPVNTFRVVLNKYFSTQFPLLDDRSWMIIWEDPIQFSEAPVSDFK